MTVIALLGAGSVVFTRELLADILSFAELRDVALALHDIDPERLATTEAIARRTADQLGAAPTITASLDHSRTGRDRRRHARPVSGRVAAQPARGARGLLPEPLRSPI